MKIMRFPLWRCSWFHNVPHVYASTPGVTHGRKQGIRQFRDPILHLARVVTWLEYPRQWDNIMGKSYRKIIGKWNIHKLKMAVLHFGKSSETA
jgi:hypothetical protein